MALITENTLRSLDEETASLVIQLQLDDCQDLLNSGKGKQRAREQNDVEIALRLFMEELAGNSLIVHDRRMTRSIANAVQTDGDIVAQSLLEEEQTAQDRKLAQRLSGSTQGPSVRRSTRETAKNDGDEGLIGKLSALRVSGLKEHTEERYAPGPEAESSKQAAARKTKTSHIGRQCVSCLDQKNVFDVAPVPCGHEYCRDCLEALFQAALTDESLFPPRCCRQSIPPGTVQQYLKPHIHAEFEKKKIEFATPNRTYCWVPNCSAFINAKDIKGPTGKCRKCGSSTCTTCKREAHKGDCPFDVELQQVLEIATDNNWQRCYACRTVVELQHGCNHITCRCGAQFCYICGEQWKRCGCAQWNEPLLFARAEQIVNRRRGNHAENIPAPIGAQPAHVQTNERVPLGTLMGQVVQDLRANHNCDHQRWQYIRGPHRCEECYCYLPQYIFQCQQCQLQACNRCRRNRL